MRNRLRSYATALTATFLSVALACALVPATPAWAQEVSRAEGKAAVQGADAAEVDASAEGEARTLAAGEAAAPTAAESAAAPVYDTSIPDANRFQLVLVVRFAGDTTGDGDTGLNDTLFVGRTEWQALFDSLNGFSDSPHLAPTLYSYLKNVSDGQCRLRTLAPQAEEGTGRVRYLTLPKTRDSYTAAVAVVEDALAAFNAAYPDFDGRILDGDGDGFADNVLVVPEVGADTPAQGSPLWSHKGDFTGAGRVGSGARSAKVGTYTMVASSGMRLSVGTVVHETIHAFGAKDLYRAGAKTDDAANRPVGVWDIMAEHGGSKLMRPLAITRQDCGWTKLEEVPGGTITLYGPGSGRCQAVKFKTDLNASEYFVAEFRQASPNSAGYAALDVSSEDSPMTIGGSGLVVYRVNPAMKSAGNGNKGDKDYVYIFRSGETGGPRGDGAGDLRHAQLTASGRSSVGVAAMDAGLTDGALTYSDGQNSGVMVAVTAQTADSITFDIRMPDTDRLGLWKNAVDAQGSTALTETGFTDTSLVKGTDGSLYQLCPRASGAAVYRFDGTAWTSLGNVGADCNSFSGLVYRNELYVAGASYGAKPSVGLWRWNGQAWKTVASVAASANRPVLGEAGGRLYLFADGSGGAARLYGLDGSALKAVGRPLGDVSVAGAALFDVGGEPAVMVGNFADWHNPRTELWRMANGTWKEPAFVHDGFAQAISPWQDGTRAFALTTTQDGAVRLVDLAGGGSSSGRVLPLPAAFAAALTVKGDDLYVAAVEQKTQIARVYRASVDDRAAWQQVGANVVSPSTAVDIDTLGAGLFLASVSSVEDPAVLRQYGAVGPGAITPLPALPALPDPVPTAPAQPAQPAPKPATPTPSKPATPKPAPSAAQPAAKPKPRATAFTKVKGAKRALSLRWKKQTKNVTGYQIRYSTSKKFTKKTTKTVWVKSAKKTSLTVKKLKAKKTYYVQIRTYKKVGAKYYYASWSKTKKAKTK